MGVVTPNGIYDESTTLLHTALFKQVSRRGRGATICGMRNTAKAISSSAKAIPTTTYVLEEAASS